MKRETTQIHTTLATGTEKLGGRIQYRQPRAAAAERAFTAVQSAYDTPLTWRKRNRRVTVGNAGPS